MRRLLASTVLLAAASLLCGTGPARPACCYFAAKDKDVNQPGQKAFLTWNADEQVETFTVQPRFEGNARDFGMVIPTPSKPKLDEMPRDFFKELAVFTILEPMDLSKYKQFPRGGAGVKYGAAAPEAARATKSTVKVLEAGIVGSLDYKIITAERADDLYAWLKEHQYSYGGDEATLDHYIKQKWFFTVMKIDPAQMKKRPDGSYDGEVTPTRFQFSSEKLIYPLKITQISVKNQTEALFYVQAKHKVDLTDDFSYQFSWVPMWSQATSYAIPEKLTKQEQEWQKLVQPKVADYLQKVNDLRQKGHQPATLEWAKKVTDKDIGVLEGKEKYNRDAPPADVKNLVLLKGHVQKGQFITKLRKVFAKNEMDRDLEFVPAKVGGQEDAIEYFSILPTSPP